MNPVHVNTKRSFWLLRAAGSAVIGAVAIFSLRAGLGSFVGWFSLLCLAFGGIGTAVGLIHGLRRGPRITLDTTGVHDRTLGVGVIPWSDIARVEPYGVAQQGFVGLHLHDAAPYLARASVVKRLLARLNAGSGFPAFSVNLAGVDADPQQVAKTIVRMHAESHRPPGSEAQPRHDRSSKRMHRG